MVLALTLMDPLTLSWLQRGGRIITSNCLRERGVGHFNSLIDMIDPRAAEFATDLITRPEMRATISLLTSL